MVWGNRLTTDKKWNLYPMAYTKNNFGRLWYLNVKSKTLKFLEGNQKIIMFYDLREGVLKQTLKVSTIMEKIDKLEKLNYIKIKNAYALKDTTKQ